MMGMSWLDGITDLIDMSVSIFQEIVLYREAWHAAVHGVAKSQIRQQLTEGKNIGRHYLALG